MTQARPIPVTVFAVFDLVIAAFGILGILGSLVAMLFGAESPALELGGAIRIFQLAVAVVGPLATVALLIGAIGLLRLRPWGRMLCILWCWYTIVVGTLATVVMHEKVTMPMLAQQEGLPPVTVAIMSWMTYGIQGGFVAFCIAQIVVLSRRATAEAFLPLVAEAA